MDVKKLLPIQACRDRDMYRTNERDERNLPVIKKAGPAGTGREGGLSLRFPETAARPHPRRRAARIHLRGTHERISVITTGSSSVSSSLSVKSPRLCASSRTLFSERNASRASEHAAL